MSLVNDALKRAKEAQQQATPPPPSQMQFRPVEPGQQAQPGRGLIVPVSLAVVAFLALVLVWRWTQGPRVAEPREARAVTRTDGQPAAASQPASISAAVNTPAVQSAPSPLLQTESRPTHTPGIADTLAAIESAPDGSPAAAKEQADEPTNSVAMASAAQPKPAPLRLQAIVFNPKRPSALISGKTVFIGDKLGDARVVAIDQESATLISAGKTNLLSLPE